MESTYAMVEYIAQEITDLVDQTTIEFYPSSYAPEGAQLCFGTYNVHLGRDYKQPYIHVDLLQVSLYHTSFDTTQRMADRLLGKLNNENVYDNAALMSAGRTEGVRWQEVSAMVTGSDQAEFVDSTNYYYVQMTIPVRWVDGPREGADSHAAFISGI